MVVSTGLAKHVATVLGLPETSVASHVRNLREGGLLTKTGRGITAAHMTSRDAAHLLIAASASLNVKDSVKTLEEFGSLILLGRQLVPFSPLRDLRRGHTVLDALTALLDAAGKNEFVPSSRYSLFVRFYRPLIKVELEGTDLLKNQGGMDEYKSEKLREGWEDLETRSTFTEMTILQVGALVAGLIEPE